MARELVMHGRLIDAKHVELDEPAGLRGEVDVILRARKRGPAETRKMDEAEDELEKERSEWEGFGQGA